MKTILVIVLWAFAVSASGQSCDDYLSAEEAVESDKDILVVLFTHSEFIPPETDDQNGLVTLEYEVLEVIKGHAGALNKTWYEIQPDPRRPSQAPSYVGRKAIVMANNGRVDLESCWGVRNYHPCERYQLKKLTGSPVSVNRRCETPRWQ